jgi:ATP-dependent DNA ligase
LSGGFIPARLQVCLYAFDCLHLNGETLIQRPLVERRAALHESIEEREGELLHAKTLVRSQPTEAKCIDGIL